MKAELFMSLQHHEDEATADCCSCRLSLAGDYPEFFMCAMHNAARDLLTAADDAIDTLEREPRPDDADWMQSITLLRSAVYKAEKERNDKTYEKDKNARTPVV
jgi:hypothetical protein